MDIKCPSLLKIVYHLTKWWILMYIIFGHFLEGLNVKCPNSLMILKLYIYYWNHGHWYSQIWIFFRRFGCQVSKFPLDFVSPNKIVDVDVHNSRYSHEGLDSNVKTTLWYLKLCISYGNSGNWYSQFGPLKSILSILVNFDLVLSIWSSSIHSVQFNDALGGEVCVKREVTSVTIMSYSQHNVGRFWIKYKFSYILVLYFF